MTSPWDFMAVKKGSGASFSMVENGFQAMKDEMHRYFEQTVGQSVSARQPLEVSICINVFSVFIETLKKAFWRYARFSSP